MKIQIPENCPCCDYPLELVNAQLFCRNTACSAQLNSKVQHFCKTLGIKGMGSKTLEKLQLSDVTEIYYLDVNEIAEALGSVKTAQKLIEEIDKSRESSLEQVLPAFSIPLFGSTAAAKISSVVANLDEINHAKCKEAGLGDKVTQNLLTFIETDLRVMKEFLPFSFKTNKKAVSSNSNGISVCVTGKLSSFKTKSAAYSALSSAGYTIVESVTKTTNILVDEENKGSSKRQKAESLGIEIINNLSQFLKDNIHD